MDNVKEMELKDAIQYLTSKLTKETVAKILGITKNQVYKYETGFTKSCGDDVVDALYDNFGILVKVYKDEEEYLKFREIREKTKE